MTSFQLPTCQILTLPSVESGVEWQQQHATWLYRGLLEGRILDYGDHTEAPSPRQVSLHEIGRLPLPGGRLAVGDVFLADGRGIPQPLPVGAHTCVVAMGTGNHECVVAALLLTGTEPIVRWSQGLVENGPDDDIEVGGFYGFPIDTGVAAFFDPTESETMDDLAHDTDATVIAVYDKFEENGFSGAMMQTLSGRSVAVFSTGMGDGHYPAWFGHAANGSVSAVVADFFVFDDPYRNEDNAQSAPAPVGWGPSLGAFTDPAPLNQNVLTQNDLNPLLTAPLLPPAPSGTTIRATPTTS